jgi:hypothetical protein
MVMEKERLFERKMVLTKYTCLLIKRDQQYALTVTGKGKAVPLQALTGLEGSRRLRLSSFSGPRSKSYGQEV